MPGARPWREATRQTRAWVQRLPPGARLAVIARCQPDSLAAGVILRQSLRRAGWRARLLIVPPGVPAWDERTAGWVRCEETQGLVIVGLAPPAASPLPGRPALVVGQRPFAAIDGATIIGGVGWPPVASDAVVAFWLGQALVSGRSLAWVAALGAMAALGERTSLPLVIDAKREHGGQWLHEALVLLRAACRHEPASMAAAASLLVSARDPRELVVADRPERDRLQVARAHVEAAIEAARGLTPAEGPMTVLVLDSRYHIQSVLADIWLARRPDRPVLVANVGAVPGRVALAVAAPPDHEWLARFLASVPDSAVVEPGVGGRHEAHLPAEAWSSWAHHLGVRSTFE